MTENKVTVDYAKPSLFHSPQAGTFRDRLNRFRRYLGYRVYRRLLARYSTLEQDKAQQSIIDIGCGPGYLISFLEDWYPNSSITGFEYDRRLIDEARQRTSKVRLVQGNAEAIPFEESEFDAVISFHLIEHLYQPELLIKRAYEILKPGGVFILVTPNPSGIGARVMGEQWRGFCDVHVALKSPDEWSSLCREYHFLPLLEHTTLLSGIPAFTKFPLGILNWGLLALFGSFPWKQGEAYLSVWRKPLG